MAIQDSFIGNLRKAQGSGLNGLRQPSQRSSIPAHVGTMVDRMLGPRVPRDVDQPAVTPDEERWQQRNAAWNGSINLDSRSDDFAPAMNGTRYSHQVVGLPRTTKEWDDFDNSVPEFKKMLEEYSNEPDQQKRFWILKRAAPKFENVNRLYKYLNIMFADELGNMAGDYPSFDYRQVQPDIEDAIKEVLNFRYHNS